MNKKFFISIGILLGCIGFGAIGYVIAENDLLDEIPSFNKKEVVLITNGKKEVITQNGDKEFAAKVTESKKEFPSLFGAKVNVVKNKSASVGFQQYNNGLFSMQIPKGWVVGVANTDFVHYTFMVYNPKNPDYRIFFNMKSEGYLKTQQMKSFYQRYNANAPFAKLPVITPQTTEGFYKIFTQAFALEQNIIPFKVPVIKNFKSIQTLGKNVTGGTIVRAKYQNEQGKTAEGVFTATIKEFNMPPVVALTVYNNVFFTVPENELVDWMPVLNHSLSTIRFSNNFINGFYQQQGQIVQNANAIASICSQTSDIITSGWNQRQKTYDILSQKKSDEIMGYDRVRNTETGEIYKAELGFMDRDWHGKYEHVTDDMYILPTAGYIERR